MEEDRKEKFERILDNYNQVSLHISRVPPKTKEEFKQFANEEFCDDFGMAFKHIWDNFKGVNNFEVQTTILQLEELNQTITNLSERIQILESRTQQKETVKKNILGTELK